VKICKYDKTVSKSRVYPPAPVLQVLSSEAAVVMGCPVWMDGACPFSAVWGFIVKLLGCPGSVWFVQPLSWGWLHLEASVWLSSHQDVPHLVNHGCRAGGGRIERQLYRLNAVWLPANEFNKSSVDRSVAISVQTTTMPQQLLTWIKSLQVQLWAGRAQAAVHTRSPSS
jgi:hypothetical protein